MASDDIAVIGGGVKGAANFYALTYTNADVVLIEKYKAPGLVNSNMLNNSQTLHVGDIETNFTLEKALKVRAAALHTQSYLSQFDAKGAIHSTYHKMVIGAGEETGLIKARFEEFRQHYPYLQLLGPEEIGELEPSVMQGRKGDISAIYSPQGHAVDYGMLAQSFVDKGI